MIECYSENCHEQAVAKIVHVGTQEIFYCEQHLQKYCNILLAMGSPAPVIYRLNEEVSFKFKFPEG